VDSWRVGSVHAFPEPSRSSAVVSRPAVTSCSAQRRAAVWKTVRHAAVQKFRQEPWRRRRINSLPHQRQRRASLVAVIATGSSLALDG
jgi:hypothetical protein